MPVLLTGAAGYLGGAILDALRAAGHTPLALAHTPDTAAALRARGVTPVAGDLRDLDTLAALAARADAVIHAANTNAPDAAMVDAAATSALLRALRGTDRPFVYTSGVWVLGPTGDTPADETAPLRPPALVSWRAAVEREVREAPGVRGIVLRPGIAFGGAGGIPGMVARGALPVVGDGAQRWPLVHVDDLGDLYVRALAAPAGTVLHGVSTAATMREIARPGGADADVTALPLDAARERLGDLADALALDQVVSSARTRALLDWAPARRSVAAALLAGAPADGTPAAA